MHGERHRWDGPAVIIKGVEFWYVNDIDVTDIVWECISKNLVSPDWRSCTEAEKLAIRLVLSANFGKKMIEIMH